MLYGHALACSTSLIMLCTFASDVAKREGVSSTVYTYLGSKMLSADVCSIYAYYWS